MAISSQGGHWIQMKRLLSAFDSSELILVSTFSSKPVLRKETSRYYSVKDASRWNKLGLIKQAYQTMKIVIKEHPNIVVTTGASVGIWAIWAGKMIGSKTIWVDSIANYSKLSLSGKIAKCSCSIHLTQWPHLISGKTIYKGSVL